MSKPITLSVTDDHTLFRKGLIALIASLGQNFEVVLETSSGDELIEKVHHTEVDVAILDMNMPGRSGYETVMFLNEHFPLVRVLVISMVNKEEDILRMLKIGVKGYLSKDVEPEKLQDALLSISQKGFYYTDYITGRLLHKLQKDSVSQAAYENLNDKEVEILKLFCTEMTHKEIAAALGLKTRTVDNYRDSLCKKLNVISRVGLVLFAIRNEIIKV